MDEISQKILKSFYELEKENKGYSLSTYGVPGLVLAVKAGIIDIREDNLNKYGSDMWVKYTSYSRRELHAKIVRVFSSLVEEGLIKLNFKYSKFYQDYYESEPYDPYDNIIGKFLGMTTDTGEHIKKFKEIEENKGVEFPEVYFYKLMEKGRKAAQRLTMTDEIFKTIISNRKLLNILERDYRDIQKCLEAECWKAVIILCGGCLEAILYDVLKQREAQALQSTKHGRGALEDWTLENYIEVATDLGLITRGVESFSHSLRDYRNLVHPLKEIRGNYKIQREEATASFESLKMAIRDLEETPKRK